MTDSIHTYQQTVNQMEIEIAAEEAAADALDTTARLMAIQERQAALAARTANRATVEPILFARNSTAPWTADMAPGSVRSTQPQRLQPTHWIPQLA